MSQAMVTLTVDGVEVAVPKGTLIVDAAKQAGVEIPVFCHHPKLKPVGMCRMCLVEIGRPVVDRATGEVRLDQTGRPVIQFGQKLETACTTPVGEGWVVRGDTEMVKAARREMLEFLLTSHPLDCPVCDKGGECPLQNLTMAYGPGKSRFLHEDKMHLVKRLPLGDLILLDRERCIQCARCIRFQEEIVGEPVLAFSERGRHLEITTLSQPGFDSVFSGNTTDICPVGALTTTDFRFEARPWELKSAASICPHCPVGCNVTLNVRRQPDAAGRILVQRVMPRQNEAVNEIWICDKGRFAHHFAASPARLSSPLVRRNAQLVEASWEEALLRAAEGLRAAGAGVVGVAGGRIPNEDLFVFRRLMEGLGGRAVLADPMAGGDLVQRFGFLADLGQLGQGDAVLVIASDLQEEAPIWWLRVKQAADRGASVIVANARATRLDRHATHLVRFPVGSAAHAALGMLHAVTARGELGGYAADDAGKEAAAAVASARIVVIFFGREGLDYAGTAALAQACANLLAATGHAGLEGSGLIAVWPHANTQGGWDMGLRPGPAGLAAALKGARAVYLMAADPADDDPDLVAALRSAGSVIAQTLFLTETARLADVVFPAQAFAEREGTYTSGERRVQRTFPAVPPLPGCKPDWQIVLEIGKQLGFDWTASSAAAVMGEVAKSIPDYAGISYERLAHIEPQWPHVGGRDLYFGGTAFRNAQGLGMKLPRRPTDVPGDATWTVPPEPPSGSGMLLVPVTRLFDRGTTILPSKVLAPRLAPARLEINPADASHLSIGEGQEVEVRWSEQTRRLPAAIRDEVPGGVVLVPRGVGLPLESPVIVQIRPAG